MKRLSSDLVHEGAIVDVRREVYEHEDGEEAEREVVVHPGSVAIVAWDEEHLLLVRQPREAVEVADLLEVPAGKLDVEGETRLECAQRELAEEVGVEAERWEEWKRLYTSPGFAREEVTIFGAEALSRISGHEPDPGERIEIVRWPLGELDDAIAACSDSKSLVGLLMLRSRLGAGSAIER